MKSFVACVLLFALVSGGLCARKRREAPAEAAAGPPADVPTATEIDGLQIAIDAVKAKPDADPVKIDILEALQAYLNAGKDKAADFAADFAAPPAPEA